MKINRHDQAKILSPQEITWLFDGKVGLVLDLKLLRLLVWSGKGEGIEEIVSLSLHKADVYGAGGRVRNRITFRRATTKGKQETRSVPVSPELRKLLEGYRSDPGRISFAARPYLFPGRWGRGHICPESADAILRATFKRLGIEGASTHSFRRMAITWMHNERVPIKHIQSISGHKSLSALQRYIDVTEKDKEMACCFADTARVATLSFRS